MTKEIIVEISTLTKTEKRFLSILRFMELLPQDEKNHGFIHNNKCYFPTVESIKTLLVDMELPPLDEWLHTTENLIAKGYVRENNENYSLSSHGIMIANKIRANLNSAWYDDFLLRGEQSHAYGSLCDQVYGKNLTQFDVFDLEQLNFLLKTLQLKPTDHVLDIGCGIGRIVEYISEVTKVRATGIDFAEKLIARAQERTIKKRKKLTFEVDDLNELSLSPQTFDTIISIDTLYFVSDLSKTIGDLKTLLKSHGQMGIFYAQQRDQNDPVTILEPNNTNLAKALQANGLQFKTYDFTANSLLLWQRMIDVTEKLKEEFLTEKNADLYEFWNKEGQKLLKIVQDGNERRYLYHVQLL